MKKITLLALILLPLIGFGQLAVPNSTFDTDISGWTNNGGTVSWENTDGNIAIGSLKLVATASGDRAQQTPNVTPLLGNYNVSVWVKGAAGTIFQFAIQQVSGGNNQYSSNFTIDALDDNVWKQYQYTASNLNDVGTHLRLIAKSADTFYFDDITITQIITERNNYTFDTDDDAEFWDNISGTITGPTSGIMTFSPNADSFAKIVQEGYYINASSNSHVRIIVQNLSTNDDQLRFIVPGGGNKTTTITTSDASEKTYEEDLSGVTGWTGNINNLEIGFRDADNPNGAGRSSGTGDFLINSIEFYTPGPSVVSSIADGNWNAGTTWSSGSMPGASDNIQIDHIVTINGDREANDVTVATTGSLILNKGRSLTMAGNFVNNATEDKVIIRSDSDQFSSFIVEGTSTGDIKFRRYVNAHPANDLISPPLSITSFADFYGDNTAFFYEDDDTDAVLFGPYDNSVPDYVNYLKTATTAINPGTGYRMGTTGLVATSALNFHGTIVTDPVNVSITDPSGGSPWNLIGNPYSSYIDFELFFTTANKAKLDSGLYQAIYGYDGVASDGWTIWNQNTIDTGTPLITPGQGFFVRAKVGAGTVPDDTQISFTPAMRTYGTSNDFITSNRIANVDVALAKLQLAKGSDIFKTDIYFNSNASRGLDPGYDAGAYQGNANGVYTHLLEDNTGVELAIQALPYDDFNDVIVPLGVKANIGEQITLSLNDGETTIPSNINVYLEDNVANSWTLLNTGDYTFTPSVALSGTGRFFVHFTTSTLSTEENVFNGLQIYMDQPSRAVRVKGQLASDTKAIIYDIQGRQVLEQLLNNDTTDNSIHVNSLNTGIYLVQLNNRTQNITQKVIIR